MWDTREDLVDFRKKEPTGRERGCTRETGPGAGHPASPVCSCSPCCELPLEAQGSHLPSGPALANRSSLLPHCPCPATGRAPSGALAGCGWPGVPVLLHGAWLADFLYVCILLEVSPRPVSPDSLPPPRPSELPLRTSHPPHVSRLEVLAPLRSAFVVSCLKVPT